MCDVCAVFGIGDHWTDASKLARATFPARDIQRHRHHRRERIRLLNRLVASASLSCEDWDGDAFVIYDPKGRMRIASSLAEFWREAEILSGLSFDPLTAHLGPNGVAWV